ncbi:2-dehydro-3-deoxygalactonokinase [Vibrio sp. ZSDE26]|uniref:2-dehydro-3-deoxygalactonokinase n=1 Tax=Vibrio amylolyticus TaxID=2847292 RepID=A0A9X1XHT2_9VIBR|nr:2-dehydro-3-deoxygalactonokinase [Vibrio amylolyticus]MCK6263412.1 2-dehydro-3-deoxygalactonokinase [Vibrio amylolyticus]
MNDKNRVSWLILDWGTTNFRAFAMSDEGTLVDKIEHKMGLLQVEEGSFADKLESMLSDWLESYISLPIFMAGMVGSAQGWVNVPYVSTPASIDTLAKNTHQFTLPWGAKATIIPGVSHCDEHGGFDVMRGEEVQLFGLIEIVGKSNLQAAFPGTHSKHVEIGNGTIEAFNTYMTGELFSALSTQTILGRGLPLQTDSHSAFEKGVGESGNSTITNQLFKARTHRLFGNLQDTEVHDYLSGLLIGNEVRELEHETVYLVGGEALSSRYEKACSLLDKTTKYINGDESFIVGMLKIKEAMNHEK